MPEYKTAQTEIQNLEKQYSNELQMMESELAKKSEAYEKEKATLPANIAQRREQELQELYGRMQQYYQQSQQELAQASQEKMATLTEKISKAIKEVGVAGGYLYIFDVASGIPYISETLSTDVTAAVNAASYVAPSSLGCTTSATKYSPVATLCSVTYGAEVIGVPSKL